MTTYGTIPTSSGAGTSTNLEYISRAKERIKSGIGSRQPWSQMFDYHFVGLPKSWAETLSRLRFNAAYFRVNYAIIVLFVLFLSLLWHPISLIVLIAMMAAWLFLYFLRDEPLVLLGRAIDDRLVLAVLGILTLTFLFLTKATLNILIALLIGAVLVVLHAVLRKTEDLFLDEEATGLMTTTTTPTS